MALTIFWIGAAIFVSVLVMSAIALGPAMFISLFLLGVVVDISVKVIARALR